MTRRRRLREEQHVDRWMVSYADFITLLLAFFVVMYSISSVNEGKYKVLSDSLEGIFRGADYRFKPVTVGDIKGHDSKQDVGLLDHMPNADKSSNEPTLKSDQPTQLQQVQQDANERFQKMISDGKLKVAANKLWVEIDIQSNLLFASGSAEPSAGALPILEAVAELLKKYKNPVHVEGFTDNEPIDSKVFPSNWELSAARAAGVVRVLSHYGVAPERMAAVGYGQYHPEVSNITGRGRATNRRVKIIISKDEQAQKALFSYGSGNVGPDMVDKILEQKAQPQEQGKMSEIKTQNGILFTQDLNQ